MVKPGYVWTGLRGGRHQGDTEVEGLAAVRRSIWAVPGTWIFAASRVRFTGASAVPVRRYRYRGAKIPTPWAPQPEHAAASG